MSRSLIETVIGALVLLVAGVFVAFAYSSADLRSVGGYPLSARFQSVTGLSVGSDVRLSGIKVGSVVGHRLDPKTYFALVDMRIEEGVRLPEDSSARITTEGLLGGTYLALEPGGAEATLEDGAVIEYTQSPVDLVQLLGKFIFTAGETAGEPGNGAAAVSPSN